MKVAVLGCGPAGLLAAHGAVLMGHDPVVYSVKRKSPIPGAVYLHERIPGMSPDEPDGKVVFRREGTRQGYAEKVYGSPLAPVSWDTFAAGEYPAWSMHALYDRLWNEYGELVTDQRLEQEDVQQIKEAFPLVLSSVPARVLCHNHYHAFNGATVWITDKAWSGCPEDTILYNGEAVIPWYRTSVIFGHGATEFRKPVAEAFQGTKPTSTNCNCHPEIKRVGRFGQWKKGVLVHHAFRQAMEEIEWAVGAGAVIR